MSDAAPDRPGGLSARRWRRLDALLDRALDLEPGERDAFVRSLTGEDAELRDELAALLADCGEPLSVLDRSTDRYLSPLLDEALDEALDTSGPSMEGRRLGSYRLLRLLGRGGGGRVYLARRDDDQFELDVAVKVVAPSLEGGRLRARFLAERQILARLEHPGIARLLDGGISDDGVPYLVMELVDGLPIDEHCERHGLGLRERLGLVLQVCDAVAHAHRNLVVHRDLKPGNVLVTKDGAVKVLDFGIAKKLSDDAGETSLTRTGSRWMTPEYAAPEQVRGEAVTTATDVYSLGVLLYRLLTDRGPYGETSGRHQTERAILETEPSPPSAAAGDPRRRRSLRGDLDAVVLKALRKEPERRYPGVEALAEDLRRYLRGLPVEARKGAAWYRAGKFVHRHRFGVAAAVLLVLLLVGWMVTVERQSRRIERERDRAERVAAVLPELFWDLEPGVLRSRSVSPREMLDRGIEKMEDSLASEPAIRASILTLASDVYMRMGDFARGEEVAREAFDIRRRLYGEESAETAESLAFLAQAIHRQGRAEESEPMHRRALELRRELLGPDHPEVAVSLHNYAMLVEDLETPEAAETVYREALDIRRRVLGDDRDTAYTLTNLAIVLYYQERYEEAEQLALEGLEMRRRIFDQDHPDFGQSYNILGVLAERVGDLDRAAEMHLEMIALNERSKGPDHADVGYGLNVLGDVRRKQGRPREAAEIYRRAYEIFRPDEGSRDMTAQTRHKLGIALYESGDRQEDREEGARLAVEGYEELRRLLGDDARPTRLARDRLAEVGLRAAPPAAASN